MVEKKTIAAAVVSLVLIVVAVTGVAVNLLNKERMDKLAFGSKAKVRTEKVFMLEDYRTVYIARDSRISVAPSPDAVTQVYAPVSGRLVKVISENGMNVEKGTQVAFFDTQELSLQIQQQDARIGTAEARVAQAYREMNLQNELLAFNGTSKQKRDNAVDVYNIEKQNLKTEEAAKALLSRNISEQVIVAPSTGMIVNSSVKQGMYMEKGTRLFDVADMGRIMLSFRVPAALWGSVQTGATVKIETGKSYNEKNVFTGLITDIAKDPYAINDSWQIQLLLKDFFASTLSHIQAAFNGGFTVYLPDKEAAMVVPTEGILYENGKPFVYVINADNIAERRAVVLGVSYGNDYYAISNGLDIGERVVIVGQEKLSDGMSVEVENEK